MKLNYDKETDSLYIHLMARPGADAVVINDDVVVDLDEDRNPVGFDIQHASRYVDLTLLETNALPVKTLKAR
ncbi:MAG: DUF2283 domain-containing protein [Spirochaetales bacterium]|nr:DUF2283 domain-containing protein [Spirochaetales bacterium]